MADYYKKQETRGINTTKGARQFAIKGAANQQAQHGDAQEVEAQANESARGARLRTNTGEGLNTRKGAMQRAIKGAMNRQSEHHCNAQGRESNGRLKGNAPFLASKIPEY